MLATIAADPRHLGAELGMTMVLHTWGQTLQHHPHVHCVVPVVGPRLTAPAGSLAAPASSCRCASSRGCSAAVLAEAGERLRSRQTAVLHQSRQSCRTAGLRTSPRQLKRLDWVVYAKPPFGGPEQVLAYLGRYTHRVAIANSRLLSLADGKIRFTWKDYRADGKTKVMTLDADEFIRRFRCTLCRTASIASATTVFSPMAPAVTASLSVVGCSKLVSRVPAASLPTITPQAIARSPLLTSPSVLIAVAPCVGSQPCHALATHSHSPVTRHDVPTRAHPDRARSQSCGQRCLHRHHAADQSLQSGMPTLPAPEIDATAAHSPRSPVPRANKPLSARTLQPRLNVKRQQAFATIPIVPNLPRLRSIRLL